MGHRNRKWLCILFAAFVLAVSCPVNAYADGWIDRSTRDAVIYGSSGDSSVSSSSSSEKIGTFSKTIGKFFHFLGTEIVDNILTSNGINLTVDGIVLGRMATGQSVSYTTMDMEEGNPWGVIGSYIYITIRRFIFSAYLIYFVFALLKLLFRDGNKGRAELKEFLPKMVISYGMIFFMPHIVDYLFYGRDVALYMTNNSLSSLTGSTSVSASILDTFEAAYSAEPSAFYGILYFATAFAGFFFLSNYVLQALMLMFLFGLYPVVALLGINNKKLSEGWASMFFPSIFIPFFDGVLLLVPAVFGAVVNHNQGSSGVVSNFLFAFIQLIIIWSVIPARNGILRAFGAAPAAATRGGLGGLAALGMMAMRTARSGLHKSSGGGTGKESGDSFRENYKAAKSENENARTFADADRSTMDDSDRDRLVGAFESYGDSSGGAGHMDAGDGMDDGPAENETSDGIYADNGMNEMSGGGIGDRDGVENPEREAEESVEGEDPATGIPEMDADADGIGEEELAPDGAEAAVAADEIMDGNLPAEMDGAEAAVAGDGTDIMDTSADGIPAGDGMDSYADTVTDSVADGGMSAGASYDSIPGYDSKFAEQLDGGDRDRYANLSARDAMSQEMAENSAKIQSLSGADAAGSPAEKSQLMSQNEAIDRQLDSLSSERAQIQSGMAANAARGGNMDIQQSAGSRTRLAEIDRQTSNLNSLKAANTQRISAMDANSSQIKALEGRNQQLSRGIENCNRRETSFAATRQAVGMSGQTYSSAADYRVQKQVDINRSKQANFRNFDSGRFDNILTPEKKEQFYRQRMVNNVRSGAGRAVKGAAMVSAAAVGAAAMTYGGPSAMAAGGMAGAMAGTGAVNLAASAPGKVRTAYGNVKIASGIAAAEVNNSSAMRKATKSEKKELKKNTAGTAERKALANVNAGTGTASRREGEDLLSDQMEKVRQFDRQF